VWRGERSYERILPRGKLFGDDTLLYLTFDPMHLVIHVTLQGLQEILAALEPINLFSSAIPSFQDIQLRASITLPEAEPLHATSKAWVRLSANGRAVKLAHNLGVSYEKGAFSRI